MRFDQSHEILRNPVRLDWPATDITQLTVSDAKDAYIVVRHELTAKSREHKIPIAHMSTDASSYPFQSTVDTLNIVSLVIFFL